MKNILWLDAFHGGSHQAVAEGYARHSRHNVTLLTLSTAGGWRWRMRGAAVSFARQLGEHTDIAFDLIIATDMLDLASFLGLTRKLMTPVPVALYMHENQLTYPLPANRQRDLSFPWINYTSALAADAIFFNSDFHRQTWLQALPSLAGRFHDHRELELIEQIGERSHVLYPGIDMRRFDFPAPQKFLPHNGNIDMSPVPLLRPAPTILWNSRWDYDKGPQVFFDALRELQGRQLDFRLIVAGEHVDPNDAVFATAHTDFADKILSWGYVTGFEHYRDLLYQADIVVSAAQQEFFGIAVLEAMYCGCLPVLPRRLSYPELLPAELHEICLYANDDQLADHLENIICNLPTFSYINTRNIAQQFDWEYMAPHYDAVFEALV